MPVSLSPGHIRTPEFTINVESGYWVEIAPQPDPTAGGSYCAPSFGWSLSNRGRVIASGRSNPSEGGQGFEADEGQYVLDVEILQDGSRCGVTRSRLAIRELGHAFAEVDHSVGLAFLTFLVLAVPGTCMVIRSSLLRRHEKLWELIRLHPLTQPGLQPAAEIAGAGECRRTPGGVAVRGSSRTRERSVFWRSQIIRCPAVIGALVDCSSNVSDFSRTQHWDRGHVFRGPNSPQGANDSSLETGSHGSERTGSAAGRGPSGIRRAPPTLIHELAACILGGFRRGSAKRAQPLSARLACVCRGRSRHGMGGSGGPH